MMANMLSNLVDRFISIAQNGDFMYINLASQPDVNLKIKTIARVFGKEEEKHIALYRQLKDEISEETDFEVDYALFGKVEKILNDLNATGNSEVIKELKNLLEVSLEFERGLLALLIEIRNMPAASGSPFMDLLDTIVSEVGRHVSNIEGYVR